MRTIRALPRDTRDFFRMLMVTPFETALGITSIYSGIASFSNSTVSAALFNQALPAELVAIFNVVYVVCGFAIVGGTGWRYRNLESFGLILLLAVLIARFMALVSSVGYTTLTSSILVQAFTFGFAACARLYMLIKGRNVIVVLPPPEAVQDGNAHGI